MADLKVSITLTPSGETCILLENGGGGNYREEAKLVDENNEENKTKRARSKDTFTRGRISASETRLELGEGRSAPYSRPEGRMQEWSEDDCRDRLESFILRVTRSKGSEDLHYG